MVSFRKIFAAVLAPVFLSGTTQAKGLFETESTHSLVSRQVASGNICAEVDLTLLGIVIARDVCVCLAAGVITPASLTRVTQTIRANQGVLAPIINVVGGVTGATTRVVSGLAPLVLQEGTTCTYPTNSVPNQCGGCGYECASGYYACGNQCILNSRACVSGVPQRRALQARDNSAALCPTGFEACLLPGSTAKSLSQFSGFECIKTNSDLESCGGCVNPLPGKPTGSDCSSIPNIASASCTSGQCVVESCIKGFKLIDGACVAVTNGKKLSGYWEALSEAGKEAGKIAIQV